PPDHIPAPFGLQKGPKHPKDEPPVDKPGIEIMQIVEPPHVPTPFLQQEPLPFLPDHYLEPNPFLKQLQVILQRPGLPTIQIEVQEAHVFDRLGHLPKGPSEASAMVEHTPAPHQIIAPIRQDPR